jgi:hypothetical protein
MGNCPSGFQVNPANGMTCVVQCPADKGFDVGVVENMPACIYRDDRTVFVKLTPVQGIQAREGQEVALEDLRRGQMGLYNRYKQAQENFNKDFPVAFSKVEKDRRIADAFRQLQAADSVRDESPQAYQEARRRYYTLVKGDGWIEEEKNRIMTAEVAPKITQYLSSYEDMNTRISQQQQTLDVVNNVKDKVITMKDEFEFATNTFSKQIDALKNQINIEKKERQKDNKTWIELIFNILIVIAGIVAVVLLARKMMSTPAYTQRSPY